MSEVGGLMTRGDAGQAECESLSLAFTGGIRMGVIRITRLNANHTHYGYGAEHESLSFADVFVLALRWAGGDRLGLSRG